MIYIPTMRSSSLREALIVIVVFTALTVMLTYPLGARPHRLGRLDSGDTQWNIWAVAWVARTLVLDPLHVYDANIFYPHRTVLAFSESNLGGGLLAIPVYWATGNAMLAHNIVAILGFALAGAGTYYLASYLTGSRGAAVVAAIGFAFSPYMLSRIANYHLLLVAGLIFGLLAFHRFVEKRTIGRSLALAVVLVAQALSAGYYGIFAILLIGLAVFFYAFSRRLWRDRMYWLGVICAATVTVLLILPILLIHVRVQQEQGLVRTLDHARDYSASWHAYLASPARAHRWMHGLLRSWNEVLFPGFLVTTLGVAGLWTGIRQHSSALPAEPEERRPPTRETVTFYGLVGVLAFWGSFGPDVGLYTILYRALPLLSFLRAPARLGVLVTLSLAILAAFAVQRGLQRLSPRTVTWAAVGAAAVMALECAAIPLFMREAQPVAEAYRVLARLPRGPVAEFPFYHRPSMHRHALYMLNSTTHWFPLINGYSDYAPPDFWENAPHLAAFPSERSFEILRQRRARYIVLHLDHYNSHDRLDLLERLDRYERYLRPLVRDNNVWLYEVVAFPS